MSDFLSIFFYFGALIHDLLELWSFALIFLVIGFDALIGMRSKSALIFCVLQALGLTLGFVWVMAHGGNLEASGWFFWLKVLGAWATSAILFHIVFALHWFWSKRA
ncbi:MAG: hypothetical protein AAF641_04320 [Pseudomonadota bacterium]